MPNSVVGTVREIILAQFEPDEDLLLGLKAVAKQHNVVTGVVLSVTGAVRVASLGYFDRSGPLESTAMKKHDLTGPFEVSGHGLVGVESDGEPYVHVHLTVTSGNVTVCGHLEQGCLVRSLIPASHFTIAVARIEGAELHQKWDRDASRAFPMVYPEAAPYHELRQVTKQNDHGQ